MSLYYRDKRYRVTSKCNEFSLIYEGSYFLIAVHLLHMQGYSKVMGE